MPELSPAIRSCERMLYSQSNWTFRHLPDQQKRWIGFEDVLQDAFISALEAEKRYKEGLGAKFSTYLYTGLPQDLSRTYLMPARAQKRTAAIVELDAPISTDDDKLKVDLPDIRFVGSRAYEQARAFVSLCRAVSVPAAILLVKGLLCEQWSAVGARPKSEAGLLNEIRQAAEKLGIGYDELLGMARNEESRKMALIELGGSSSIGLGTEMLAARILECINCSGNFPLAAIGEGRYVVETMTCRACYNEMAKAPVTDSCFGKLYSVENVECRLHCRDRNVCQRHSQQKGTEMATKKVKATSAETDTLDDVDFSDVTPAAAKPAAKTEKKLKSAKSAKKVAAAKSEKQSAKPSIKAPSKAAKAAPKTKTVNGTEIPAPPAEVGPSWPHKTGSAMQYCFRRAFDGVKADKLQAEIESMGLKWPIMLSVLRGGKAGTARVTHTWKLNEEGGRLQVYDVKYIGGAAAKAPAKAEKPAKKAKAAA